MSGTTNLTAKLSPLIAVAINELLLIYKMKNWNLIELDGSIGQKEKSKSIDHFNKFPTNITTPYSSLLVNKKFQPRYIN